MSSQDAIANAMIRHQIFIQRFGSGVGKKTVEALQAVTDAAIRRLMSGDLTDFQVDRLRLLGADMQLQYRTMIDGNLQERMQELKDFALYEAEFSQGLLETNIAGSVNLPTPDQINAAVDLSKMKVNDGKFLSMTDVFKSFTNKGARQIAQEISDGAILGETNRQIADRLERLSGLHKNQAMTITRTATNNVATVARTQVMQENEDVLDGYEWVAALDNRTTILCGSLDGQVFSFNDPDAPKPPAHFNCRSTIVPKVKPEFTLGADIEGERPAIGADGKEQIGAGTNYETWLRRQPAAFQDEVLGKERGKLFRGKKLSLDRFIDAKGNPIPLDSLKTLDESFNLKAKTTAIVDTISKEEKPKGLELVIPDKRIDAITPEFISEVDSLGRVYENEKTARYTRIANYDNQPTIVSEADFDAIKGDTLFRGVTDYDDATGKELVNQYFDDEHFIGGGVFGSGTYTSYGPNPNMPKATGFDVASQYGYSNGSGAVFRMKLKPNAKVYNYRSDKPYDLVDEALSKLGFEPIPDIERKLIAAKNAGENALADRLRQRIRLIEDIEISLSADTSRAAIIAGYDAVNIVENRYMVVLNRGAVVTDRKIWELD